MAKAVAPALSVALTIAAAVPAGAETPTSGIAFAQAQDGIWWCRAGEHGHAIACALDKCDAESGGEACAVTRWCYPAGWSGLMVTWLPEFRATHVICGAPNGSAVRAALEATCGAAEEYTRCDFVLLIDPDGKAQAIPETTWPGPATRGSPSGSP